MDKNTLSHTTWECKYHIVFAPKFRRQVIYGAIKADVANILSTLCKRKGVEIIGAEWWQQSQQVKKRKRARKAHTQAQAGKIFIMIGLEAQRKHKHGWSRPVVHKNRRQGGSRNRPAIKTATPTMGGVRVRSPYKQLTGCNGGHCGVG